MIYYCAKKKSRIHKAKVFQYCLLKSCPYLTKRYKIRNSNSEKVVNINIGDNK